MFGQTQFEGGVFQEAIPGGRASAAIEISASGIEAVTSTGQKFYIAWRDCQLDMGGATGRMVFCRTADRKTTIFCEDRKFPGALELEAGAELKDELDVIRGKRRSERAQFRFWLVFSLVACVLLLIGGYYGLLAIAKASIVAIPISVDEQIGDLAFDSVAPDGDQVTDPVIVNAVQSMVDRLKPHSELKEMKFDVKVFHSADVNAFCLPGGRIVVFTGLLKKAKSPEQVAGVLSHEMAHAIKRHGLQQVTQSLGIVVAFELMIGDVGGLVALAVELGKNAALTSYSREYEIEADVTGVRMLHAAGLDPLALAGFFEMLRDEGKDVPAAIAWLSTHPQHEIRIQTIRAELANLGKQEYRPLEIDWDEVQKHLDQLGAAKVDLPL